MTLGEIEQAIDAQIPALMRGDCTGLSAPPFAGCSRHRSPNGSTVIAVALQADALAALPESHRWLDLFLLEPHARLGRHYHRHAAAHIRILAGHGALEVDEKTKDFAPGDTAFFPAGARHDVSSREEPVLFQSFQNNPIIQPDGSLDYFTDEEGQVSPG